MPGALADGDGALAGADALHLAEGGAGHHEGEALVLANIFQFFPSQSQAVAVHRDHGELAVLHLKEGAGVDGAALVVADGEESLGNHGTQHALLQDHGILLLHRGQLGEFLGVGTQDVEFAHATFNVDHIVLGGENHHVIGHFADNFAEQAGGEDQGAGLLDLGGDGGLDSGLQVIAGEAQAGVRLDEDALHGGNRALGGYRPGGCGNRSGKQRLFTGKFHGCSSLWMFSLYA